MWNQAEKTFQKDIYLSPLIEKWGPCTIEPKLSKDYFAGLVGNIVGQQLSGKVADVIEGRLIAKLNNKVTPDNILNIDENVLRNCGMAWAKVYAIKDLAKKTASGELEIDKLSLLSDEDVRRQLIQVKGIGPWTADMFLMFKLGRPDIFPTNDLGIKNGFEKVTGKKWEVSESLKFAEENWKPWRTVASWYLWRSLD